MDKLMDPVNVKDIMKGGPLPLISRFKITYIMILNILRLDDGDPEEFVRKSYGQFMSQRSLPDLKAELLSINRKIEAFQIENENKFNNFYNNKIKYWKYKVFKFNILVLLFK